MATVPRLHKETSLFDKSIAEDLGEVSDVANAASPKSDAIKRTQRIWYRKNSSGAPSTPGTESSNWVTKDNDGSNAWTKMHVAITSTDKYIYTCEQYEMANGTVGYTSVLLDNTITVIDGGNIITGSVSANVVNASSGTFDVANIPNLDAGKITTGQLSAQRIDAASLSIGYSQINNPPSIPTKTSDLTNDSNFATTSQVNGAAQTATDYVTVINNDGIWVTPSDAKPVEGSATSQTNGWHISNAIELFRAGVSAFKVWVENNITKVRIGRNDSGNANIVLDPNGINFLNGNNEFAELAVSQSGMVSLSSKNLSSSGYYADVRTYETELGSGDEAVATAHTAIAAGYNENGTIHPAYVEANASPSESLVRIGGDTISVVPGGIDGISSIYAASMENLAALIACRMYLAGGDITIPANSGASARWNWQGSYITGGGVGTAASFPDTNYIVSIGKSGNGVVNGFNNVDFMVIGKATDSVTVYGWNSNSYSVTLHVTCIGFNSRYGTRT